MSNKNVRVVFSVPARLHAILKEAAAKDRRPLSVYLLMHLEDAFPESKSVSLGVSPEPKSVSLGITKKEDTSGIPVRDLDRTDILDDAPVNPKPKSQGSLLSRVNQNQKVSTSAPKSGPTSQPE